MPIKELSQEAPCPGDEVPTILQHLRQGGGRGERGGEGGVPGAPGVILFTTALITHTHVTTASWGTMENGSAGVRNQGPQECHAFVSQSLACSFVCSFMTFTIIGFPISGPGGPVCNTVSRSPSSNSHTKPGKQLVSRIRCI